MTTVLPPLHEPDALSGAGLQVPRRARIPLSNWGGSQKMITSYSVDYGKKDCIPTKVRPCSATRRNRPHPSKYFMNWRLPSKPILDRRSGYIVEPKSSKERFILQNFYEEYKGSDEPKRSVQLPNISKGTYEDENLKLMEKLKISAKPVVTTQLPLPALNPEQLSLVTDLLMKATPQEQEVLEKAFGFNDSLDQSPYTLISPEAISVLEQVLENAGITDNDTAIRFLLSVGQVIMTLSNSKAAGQLSPRPKAPNAEAVKLRRATLRSPTSIHSPNVLKQKHKEVSCNLCSKSGLTSKLRRISDKNHVSPNAQIKAMFARSYLENVPRLPKIAAPKRIPPRTKTWHTMPNYPPQGQVENKLATFVLPHRPIPRSFTIHPEWS